MQLIYVWSTFESEYQQNSKIQSISKHFIEFGFGSKRGDANNKHSKLADSNNHNPETKKFSSFCNSDL